MHRSPPIGYNAAMKLQFSLATLMVCLTVLAVVCALAATIPVSEDHGVTHVEYFEGPPSLAEMAQRFATWGLPSIATTLATLWAIRRLKSRRHAEPPVG